MRRAASEPPWTIIALFPINDVEPIKTALSVCLPYLNMALSLAAMYFRLYP
jgi:hypothetical protein